MQERKRLGIVAINLLQDGQPRPYADHYYIWEIETGGEVCQKDMEVFCQTYLRKNTNPFSEWKKNRGNSADEYFKGYFKLTFSPDSRTYRYTVMEPFCG